MRIKSLRIRLYKNCKVVEAVAESAVERYRTLQAYDQLRAAVRPGALAQLEISQHSLYRWKCGAKARTLGELVQTDHMSVSHEGDTLKEFKAICILSENSWWHGSFPGPWPTTSDAFLRPSLEGLPYPLRSVQVSDGSEFRTDFEATCEALDLPLVVLSPKTPQFNGVVERANDSLRTEF